MIDRLTSALVAFILGFLVWLYARSREQEVLDNMPVPVQITLAPGQADHYDLEINGPAQVTASFTGPPSRIRELRGQLQRGELQVTATFTVPEERRSAIRYLDTVRIDAADLHPPPGVRPMVTEGRNRIPVTVRRVVERRLPVRLDYAPEERVSQITLKPASVVVRGPQEILDRVRTVPTEPYILPTEADASPLPEVVSTAAVPLVSEVEGRPIRCSPGTVSARLTLKPQQKVYELADVPVQFLCPANFGLRARWAPDAHAGKITIRVQGPAGETQPVVQAWIDLTRRKFDAGLYAGELLRLQLPKDFQLAQNPPRSGSFQLAPLPSERNTGSVLEGIRNP